MGLFDSIKRKEKIENKVQSYFETLNAYAPTFTTFEGSIYEMELTRAAIHSFATHCSKLKPEVNGSGNQAFARMMQYKPNPLMDTKKYLYRLATTYAVDNTAIVAPLYDSSYEKIIGFYPLATPKVTIKDIEGVKYIRYEFEPGNYGVFRLDEAGIMNQFQYKNELFGENNRCLYPTMELINTNNQGIIEGVKSSATLRFLAKIAQTLKPDDLEKERKRFVDSNFNASNAGGVMLIDAKYEDVKQLQTNQFTVDSAQMAQIKENVFNYFGTNEDILQNKFTSDQWGSYYEGKIEPFAIEASLVHTNMKFNQHEIAFGNEIIFTANRLQYASNKEKLEIVTQLFDRGFLTHNMGLEVFNMASIGEEGNKRYIRKEYGLADYEQEPNQVYVENTQPEGGKENANNEQ
ncbi:MAG: phage portal protein [Alphaproteobacteria bacterium]|nr:phage portal protein [Alphaproteobacteria bacterium]